MKIYKTKNRLIFSRPTIVGMIRDKWNIFVAENGHEPKEIYMSKNDLKEYQDELGGVPETRFLGDTYFKGVKIKEM
jgi:hypothetical protein